MAVWVLCLVGGGYRHLLVNPRKKVRFSRTAQAKNAKSGLREFLPWKPFRTIFLPLVVACFSAARSGTPCPPLELRPCCMSPERPF